MSTYFLAEVSSNHNADLQRCLNFIDTAAAIGCNGIKFQLFSINKLFAPEILAHSEKHRNRKNWELPANFLPAISERCAMQNIEFCCTPFDIDAVNILIPYVSRYKISSYELTWPALLQSCAATCKPVILSTGMATLDECISACNVLTSHGCKSPTLLHCVSHYPASTYELNLAAMELIRESCNCAVGWSDHSKRPGVIYQAVFGHHASLIEFHLDLDGTGNEYCDGHCWLPEDICSVITNVREGEAADGIPEKHFTKSESMERFWRADPLDGLRPFRKIRSTYVGDKI